MKITLRYFAVVREKTGLEHEVLELQEGCDVASLWTQLERRHGALEGLKRHVRVAVNLEYVNDGHLLRDGDEVALIPPVAGGSELCTLVESSIAVESVVGRVRRPEAGAVVTFEGVVRNHAQGKAVVRLEYEVYPEMALAKLREVAAGVEAEFEGCMVAVEHRFGSLEVGETAVVIAVSSAHRAAAFAACAATIDRIKEVVPIWKKEFGPDGSHWVGFGS